MAEAFVLDRGSILERLGGDEEIYAMMVGMFLQDVENNCTAIAAAFAQGDAAALRREAHTIKGLLATFSDDGGAADAAAVEHQAKVDEIGGLGEAVSGLQQRLREVASALGAG
jgi:HPt (histidine-containing phosphotransfer) domain-containing protein